MPIPLIALGIAAGAAAAGAGVAKGAGDSKAAKKSGLTNRELRELEELERRKLAGDEGLSQTQRGAMEQQFLMSQSAGRRQAQAEGLQQAAAQGLGSGVSGRDIFLRKQAQEAANIGSIQDRNVEIARADEQQALVNQARMDSMRAQQKAAEAAQAQAKASMVSSVFTGASQALGGAFDQQAAMELQQAQISQISDEELLRRMGRETQIPSYYSTRIGVM